MSQTYYTNLTFLWYILPTASNILLHLLTLAALHTHTKKSLFFHFIPPITLFMHRVSHTHPQKGTTTRR